MDEARSAGGVTEQAVTWPTAASDHDLTLRILLEVSRLSERGEPPETFFGRVSEMVAGLARARRAAFLRLQPDGTLALQRSGHGVSDVEAGLLTGIAGGAGGAGLARAALHDAVAVPWQAGDRPLGLLCACDSLDARGFSEAEEWALRVAGLAAGLVWARWQAETQLSEMGDAQTETLREHGRRMAELERAKSRFLHLASHELRSPVTVLHGYISMLEDGSLEGVSGPALAALPIMRTKVAQINRLIDQMLDAARLEDSSLELRVSSVDLAEVAARCVGRYARAAAPSHQLDLRRPDGPVLVDGDERSIETILVNLIDNAIKYSPQGGPVECCVAVSGPEAVVQVRDEGLGMAPEEMARLFTRFGRTVSRQTSHIGGSGLGLYLARELARLHGGELTCASDPGLGSVFTLTLPVSRSSDGAGTARAGGA